MQIEDINSRLDLVHDAILVSIEDSIRNNTSKLTLISEDEKLLISIVLNGIVSSRCINWKIGNIVLDASVIGMENQFNEKRVFELIVFSEEFSQVQIQNKAYLPILKDIEAGKLFIFELNPSYGAYFVGIAKDIIVETEIRALKSKS